MLSNLPRPPGRQAASVRVIERSGDSVRAIVDAAAYTGPLGFTAGNTRGSAVGLAFELSPTPLRILPAQAAGAPPLAAREAALELGDRRVHRQRLLLGPCGGGRGGLRGTRSLLSASCERFVSFRFVSTRQRAEEGRWLRSGIKAVAVEALLYVW